MTANPLRTLPITLCIASLFAAFSPFDGSPARAQTKPKVQPSKNVDKDHVQKMVKGLALFKSHVKPILKSRCLRCHSGRRTRGGLDLSDRKELLKGGDNGPVVIIGKAKKSLLYKMINHERKPFMPESGEKLSTKEIAYIAKWIDLGAPYDDPLGNRQIAKSWTQRVVQPDARQFWSFQPLQIVKPPKVNEPWCQTDIDRFVFRKLQTKGLRPNPQASKRKLIRRAYLDLIGIPPTPQEVEAFVNNKSKDAYPQLIDRLLQNPHHGERWASYWLDLARFAESHGFEHDYDRRTAYHYRDFVIKALNMDMPYDQFVRWQLAGDELEPENPLANMATGFLAAGVHSTQITKNEVEKHRYDELDDKLHTTGTAMLGLSFGCARCHDHKYDPIPQADYYRMLSTFTTTIRTEVNLNLEPDAYNRAKAKFDKEHQPFVDALSKFEQEQLPARLAKWETSNKKLPSWTILDITKAKSRGGAKLTKQQDGSLLVTGKKPRFDTFTFNAETTQTNITAIRLEALSHPSLVRGGPGRASNGNFALTNFRMTIRPKNGKGKAIVVGLKNPRATFEQAGLPIRATIDKDGKSAWAIDPQFGKDHAAVFETTKPVGFAGGSVITMTLDFKNNANHSIGRPRFSITSEKVQPALQGPGLPSDLRRILAIPRAKRNAQDSTQLLKWYSRIDPEGRKLHKRINDHLRQAPKPKMTKVLIASEGLPAVRLHTQGGDFFPKTYFLRRGDNNNKEGVANQSFLQVLMTSPEKEQHWQQDAPEGWRTSFRRVAFANWITDTKEGAGHLLARVIVNRLWQHHMGRGIVATPSDFGDRGARPTHPELLDWLASQLIEGGWKLKPIHKLIMMSAVYRQSSDYQQDKAKVDPNNELYWQFRLRRLEAEAIRDSLLAISTALDKRMFGPGTLNEASRRRSIYFTVKRSRLIPMMQIFDAPQALTGVGKRPSTTISTQALLLMNNPHVRNWAKSFAKRVAGDSKVSTSEAVTNAYRIALCRPPTEKELAESVAFIRQQMATYPDANRRERAFTDFCQTMMCLNELIYID
ncbi:MAG: PSD1 and planctomycete cytochrome C domain-containing protein [Gemmataceae bacterium]